MRNTATQRATWTAIGWAAAGAFVLSGCHGSDGDSDAAGTTPPPATTATSQPAAPATTPATTAAASGGGAPVTGAQAKPGQLFPIGKPATVPFASGSTKGTVAIAVTSIAKGSAADLKALGLGDRVKGMVPYYIHYTVKNLGAKDLSFTSASHIRGLLADGSEAQDVSVIGDFAKCPSDSAPSGFTTGHSYATCALALAPNTTAKVAGAEWWDDPYSLGQGVEWGVHAS